MSSHQFLTRRRVLLAGVATLLATPALGESISGHLPWLPDRSDPPKPVVAGPWRFFTPEEGSAVEALVDRIIPPDPKTVGGKDAGCAVFIDRQLAGGYGRSDGLYMLPPFQDGEPTQADQTPLTPAQSYRQALAALDGYCRSGFVGNAFRQLGVDQQDLVLTKLEKGEAKLDGADGRKFMALLIKDTRAGFFADPVYGGNVNMAGWRMIGFPGARYDYRDWIGRHNETYPLPPVGLLGRPGWNEG